MHPPTVLKLSSAGMELPSTDVTCIVARIMSAEMSLLGCGLSGTLDDGLSLMEAAAPHSSVSCHCLPVSNIDLHSF